MNMSMGARGGLYFSALALGILISVMMLPMAVWAETEPPTEVEELVTELEETFQEQIDQLENNLETELQELSSSLSGAGGGCTGQGCHNPPSGIGSITVCKIAISETGQISAGTELPDTTFRIENQQYPYAVGALPVTEFVTPLTLNTHVLGDNEFDAACVTHENLLIGHYFYSKESIVGHEFEWLQPLYNDQYTTEVTSLGDFFSYDNSLFNLDPHDDDSRNRNADGHIRLTVERPHRTLVVLNTFVAPVEPTPACSDNLDNDGDNLIDAADPGCHTDEDPDNPNSYDPNDNDETHTPPLPYAPYCGDGEVNQAWEQCDGGAQCTEQCVADAGQCTDLVLARVKVAEVVNWEHGDATSDVFLGSATNKIPASAWFPLHYNENYLTDPNIASYEDVPGLALERQLGSLRAVLHGSHQDDSKEHVDGAIEFWNVEVATQQSDDTDNNKLEQGFDGTMTYNPGNDEVWTEIDNATTSHFWLTVTSADDGFVTTYTEAPMCTAPELTIVATKIVCDHESSLPNWGGGAADITATTADEFLLTHGNDCRLEPNWSFEWALADVPNPGDETGKGGTDWHTSAPTNANGTVTMKVSADDLGDIMPDHLWIREVFKSGYVPFSHPSGDDVSAELYCHTDVLHYDNYDAIQSPQYDETYHCIAFNAPVPVEPTPACSDNLDNDGDNLIDAADPGCHTDEDPDNPNSYDPNDNDETHIPPLPYAPYCGDGEVNQAWEQCDGGAQCTEQCVADAGQCTDLVLARVNTNSVENHANGNVSSDVFVGSATNKIPASAWFPLHYNENYLTDPNIASYEDVPGLAVERSVGKVRTLLHGSHGHDGSKEHIDGDIEFWNTTLTGQTDDTSGNNKLENGFNGVRDNIPGEDEVWTEANNNIQSFFWLTVTTADDAFYSHYADAPMCHVNEAPEITLLGDNPFTVEQNTAFVDPGATARDPEDGDITANIVVGGDTVDTAATGTYAVTYNVSDSENFPAPEQTRIVVVQEPNKPNPACSDALDNDLDGNIDQDDPACHTDGDPTNEASYDPSIDSENSKPSLTLIGDNPLVLAFGTTFSELGATANDAEDGDISSNVVVAGDTVNTSNPGNYTRTYNVTDSAGLAADEVTRTVVVLDREITYACSDEADNDNDGKADAADPACHTDLDPDNAASYDPQIDSENEAPTITILGDNPLTIIQNATFTDPGATSTDPEDGDLTLSIVVAGDTVDTSATGTYTVTYDVSDSAGLAATQASRVVHVVEDQEPVTACNDGIDNDEDGKIDAADPACHTDNDPDNPDSYDPSADNENSKPIIALNGNNPHEINQGSSYGDAGATASDLEDGDITNQLVIEGAGDVDPNTPGDYEITFNVTDSAGLAADEVVRIVRVVEGTNGGGGGGGSTGSNGGGGGLVLNPLKITQETVSVIAEGTALVTWQTNKPATSRVVYDTDSHALSVTTQNFGLGSDNVGYEFTTEETTDLVTEHSVVVTNVNLEDRFFFRPISSDGTRAIGVELQAVLSQLSVDACSQYLFEFVQTGASNSDEEVRKLQLFLNEFEGADLDVNGLYDAATVAAVEAFQLKYTDDILTPWGIEGPTGYVYLTTRKKINELHCNNTLQFPLTPAQQAEVDAFRALLETLGADGGPIDTSTVGQVTPSPTNTSASVFAEAEGETTSAGTGLADVDSEAESTEGESQIAAVVEADDGPGFFGRIFGGIGNFFGNLFGGDEEETVEEGSGVQVDVIIEE